MKKYIQLGHYMGSHHVDGVNSSKPEIQSSVYGCQEYEPAGIIEIEVDDVTGQLIQPENNPLQLSENYGMKSRSDAWEAVVEELWKYDIEALSKGRNGREGAVNTIRAMAEKAKKYDQIVAMLGS